ncbi:MAG TPA: sensor domain-containing protein [Jiangellaceae bacterium]|nr:sensor domain-containing protein [Jiangellaceae bacterium]
MNTTLTAQLRPADGPEVPAPRAGWRQLPRDLTYLLLGFPIALAAFVTVVTGVVLGVSLLIIWVGIPILVIVLGIGRGFAQLERARVQVCEQRPFPPVYYRTNSSSRFRRMVAILGDPQYWRDIAYAVVAFPVKIFTWVVTITWVAVAAGGTAYLAYGWALPNDPDNETLWELLGIESMLVGNLLYTALGLVFLMTMPYALRWTAALDATLAVLLLSNPKAAENAALRAQAEQLRRSRAAAAEAEATTLRRVERDIHDGPQQRLVRLTMDLEAAQRRMDDDPDAARPLVAEALSQTQDALAELRALSRGIAPPILADRGLHAALAAAAARCPVPVQLDVALGADRPSPTAENAAYFVVTEALTNVAKHSGAGSVQVSVVQVAEMLHVQVTDDGRGGAHLGKGHGLAGLADRLAGLDGTFDVHSPAGGGTVVTAGIPAA